MTRISGAIGGVSDSALAQRGLSFGTPLVRPADFTLPRALFPFDFWRDATGRVRTGFDRKAWCPTPDVTPWATPATYYVDVTRADDSGDGLSWATAKKSINAATAAGNAGAVPFVVNVRAGLYPRGNGFNGIAPNKACAYLAMGGRVRTGQFDALNWAADQGTTFSAARSNVRRVFDLATLTAYGLYAELAFAPSLAACRATPGSWWTDNTTLYVSRADGAAVTNANTVAYLESVSAIEGSSGGNMYLSGFDVEGGSVAVMRLRNAAAYRFVAEDCSFRYSAGPNGQGTANVQPVNNVTIQDIQAAAFIRCDSSGSQVDAFNSHLFNGVQAFVFTMDCTGFSNGRPGATSCNFLTTHDGGRWIDLRGIGADNAGGQVAIVNDNTMMWCIDTFCYASRGDQVLGGGVPPSDFLVDQTEGGAGSRLFLENCAAAGSQYSLNVRCGTIYLRGGKFPGGRAAAAGGTLRSV